MNNRDKISKSESPGILIYAFNVAKDDQYKSSKSYKTQLFLLIS